MPPLSSPPEYPPSRMSGPPRGAQDLPPGRRAETRRERQAPGSTAVPTILVLLAVTTVIVGTWVLMSPRAAAPVATPTPTASSPASSPSATSVGPSASTSAAGGGSPSAPADRTVPISVLNGTTRAGLATKVAGSLRSAGWTISVIGNARNGGAATTVYYASPAQASAARTAVADLGLGRAEVSTMFGSGVTVVLGADYPG